MGCIKCFELAVEVISATIANIAKARDRKRADIVAEVVQHIKNNSGQWTSGQIPQIPYDNPLCRIAYMYGVLPANANLFEYILTNDPDLGDHVWSVNKKHGQVSICAFGGGPGTEMLGLAKWAEATAKGRQLVVDFLALDRENAWLDSWSGLRRRLNARLEAEYGPVRGKWPVLLSGVLSGMDFTRSGCYGDLGSVFGQDIYVMSYVISEVFTNFQDLRVFTSSMAACAPRGSRFVFIDRGAEASRWKDEVKTMAKQAGLSLGDFHPANRNMTNDEQIADLGQIYADVGRKPRVTWNAFWVVGTKK